MVIPLELESLGKKLDGNNNRMLHTGSRTPQKSTNDPNKTSKTCCVQLMNYELLRMDKPGGARGAMVIVRGNVNDNLSSNPARG